MRKEEERLHQKIDRMFMSLGIFSFAVIPGAKFLEEGVRILYENPSTGYIEKNTGYAALATGTGLLLMAGLGTYSFLRGLKERRNRLRQ